MIFGEIPSIQFIKNVNATKHADIFPRITRLINKEVPFVTVHCITLVFIVYRLQIRATTVDEICVLRLLSPFTIRYDLSCKQKILFKNIVFSNYSKTVLTFPLSFILGYNEANYDLHNYDTEDEAIRRLKCLTNTLMACEMKKCIPNS